MRLRGVGPRHPRCRCGRCREAPGGPGSLVGREIEPDHGLREAGDIRECELDVEETLVEQLARGVLGQGGGVAELGVDHQGGLVEPDQVAMQTPASRRSASGSSNSSSAKRGNLAGAGVVGALSALEGFLWRG